MDLPMRNPGNPGCESRNDAILWGNERRSGSLRSRAADYGSGGWGFESLRARPAQRLFYSSARAFSGPFGSHACSHGRIAAVQSPSRAVAQVGRALSVAPVLRSRRRLRRQRRPLPWKARPSHAGPCTGRVRRSRRCMARGRAARSHPPRRPIVLVAATASRAGCARGTRSPFRRPLTR